MADAANYEAVLADLRAQREELDRTIELIERRLIGLGVTPSAESRVPSRPDSEPREIASDTFFGMSIPDAIKKFLRIVKKKQPAMAIMKALEDGGLSHASKNFYSTVSTVLRRLEGRGEIVQVGKDWGLVEWYPGLKKTSKAAQRPDESAAADESDDNGKGD
jgi:hypothetical protein